MEVNVEEARNRLGHLLDEVQSGEEITILRSGEEVARIVPPKRDRLRLPHLNDFRSSIRISVGSLSKMVKINKEEKRY
jgi:prevent-host-death family protein